MNSPKQLTFPWNRVNKSSFEGFYIDPKNTQLLSLLMDTSSSNDLFIHGIKDSGKTFLLQSLCNLYNKNNKTLKNIQNINKQTKETAHQTTNNAYTHQCR